MRGCAKQGFAVGGLTFGCLKQASWRLIVLLAILLLGNYPIWLYRRLLGAAKVVLGHNLGLSSEQFFQNTQNTLTLRSAFVGSRWQVIWTKTGRTRNIKVGLHRETLHECIENPRN